MNKQFSPIGSLQAQGINIFEAKEKQPIATTTGGLYLANDTHRLLVQTSLEHTNLAQWNQLLIWENMPNGLESWLINEMLYYRGSLAMFKLGGAFYLLPYAQTGGLNLYGMPNEITPIPFGVSTTSAQLNQAKPLPINKAGDLILNENGAVLLMAMSPTYTNGMMMTPQGLTLPIIVDMSSIIARVNIEITTSTKKVIIPVDDPKTAKAVSNQINAIFQDTNPVAVISNGLQTNNTPITLEPRENSSGTDLWLNFKSFNDIRTLSMGVPNDGFFIKKERSITGEVDAEDAQTALVALDRLYFAQLFIDQCKRVWPNNAEIQQMKVSINPQLIKQLFPNERGDDDVSDTDTDLTDN